MSEANPVLVELLLQMADDELIIGHRDSEWLGLAPHIEEDIAYSSIAQDEIGHATIFYQLLAALGQGSADSLAFVRAPAARRNAVLLERPNGPGTYLEDPRFDWGYTVARRLAYDLFDAIRLEVVARSAYQPLAQVAAKIRREERYHLLHHTTWFRRLAEGTPASRAHLEAGLAKVWEDVGGLFTPGAVTPGEIFPATPDELIERWCAEFQKQCEAVSIRWPGAFALPAGLDGRRGEHTPALGALLSTMTEVYLTAPEGAW